MPDATHLVAFAVGAATIALIPGPGVLYSSPGPWEAGATRACVPRPGPALAAWST
jgi:hypothetical protein